MNSRYSIVFLFLLFAFSSCIEDKFKNIDGIRIEPSVAFPLGQAHFSLEDFVANDSIFTVDPDGLINLSYRESNIASLSYSDFINQISEDWNLTFITERKIGPIELEKITQSGSETLSHLVANFSDPIAKNFFINNNGNTIPIPPFNENINQKASIGVFNNFTYVELVSGKLVITIINGFNFPLEELELVIIDKTSGEIVNNAALAFLPAGSIDSLSFDLAGKKIYNNLEIEIPRFRSPGTGSEGANIDLNALLNIEIEIKDILISKGEVKIPALNLDTETVSVDLKTYDDEKLKELKLVSGDLSYSIQSDIIFPMEIELNFPSIYKAEQQLSESIPISGPINNFIDLADAKIYFDKNSEQPFNRLNIDYSISTIASDQFIVFDASDMIAFEMNFEDLKFEKIIGYFGNHQQVFEPSTFEFDLDLSFLDETSEPLFFENPEISISYTNGFGIPIDGEFELITTGNFNEIKRLTPQKFTLAYPDISNIGNAVEGRFTINNENSNLTEVLAVYPKTIQFGGNLNINPEADDQVINHVSSQSQMEVGLEMKLPLTFKTEQLVFLDTLTSETLENTPEEVQSATILLDYKNELPFSTGLSILGTHSNEIIRIIENIVLEEPAVDPNGNVKNPKSGRLELSLDKQQIQTLFESQNILILIEIQTFEGGHTPVSLFTDNGIEVAVGIKADLIF